MIILFPIIVGSLQSPSLSVHTGDQIIGTYRSLLQKPRANSQTAKSTEFGKLLERFENSGQLDAVKNPYTFIALRAIRAEWGFPASSFTKKLDERVKGLFPTPIRKYWSPETRRIWLEAFYIPDDRPVDEIRRQVASLRKDGANTEPLEALVMFDGVLKPKMTHSALVAATRGTVRQLLELSEKTPSDIAAVSRAISLIDLVVTDEIVRKEPIGEQDLLDRIFALEPRTIRNFNQLLNDNKPNFASFDMLRQHVADAKAKR